MIDTVIGDSHLIRDAVIFFYIANELLSIIENAGKTGLPIPDTLKKAVETLKGLTVLLSLYRQPSAYHSPHSIAN